MNLIVEVPKGAKRLLEMAGLNEQIVLEALGNLGIWQSWLPHGMTSVLLTRACDAVRYKPSLKLRENLDNDSKADTRWSS